MIGPLRALLLDYGGVLTEPMASNHSRFCRDLGIDPASLEEVLDDWVRQPNGGGPVPAMERGQLSVAAFEERLAARLRRWDGVRVPAAGLLRRLFADTRLDGSTLALVADLRAAGVRVALVSNAWGSDYPLGRLRQCIDEFVFSNQIGLRKPEPGIYLHAARQIGVEPADCLFVDDRLRNVRGAEAVGMTGLHYVDPEQGRARIRDMFCGGSLTGATGDSASNASDRSGAC
ncbi:HAD family phosphatase [Micromonospora sp. NBRC 101691]|uniref:HAD family hydrolase n=1 Tax=Micromonospora TaxID=1873 RepID=UPI0024A5C1A8|nr:HAD family phosphatase [Micromonospora sp. NBRC 101691]GLY26209.1 haloacid dehalogenase [Micromonospora sp. NBRC 101691]